MNKTQSSRNRKIAMDLGEKTYESTNCLKCEGTRKYTSNYRCINCDKLRENDRTLNRRENNKNQLDSLYHSGYIDTLNIIKLCKLKSNDKFFNWAKNNNTYKIKHKSSYFFKKTDVDLFIQYLKDTEETGKIIKNNKKSAKDKNEKYYIGKVCKKCSSNIKYTKKGSCVNCEQTNSNDYNISYTPCKNKTKINSQKYKNQNKEKLFAYHLKRTYKLSDSEYREMLLTQQNVCKICLKNYGKKLVVDHDHITGQVRGLLCKQCNTGLGMFKEDILSLENSIKYLKDTK